MTQPPTKPPIPCAPCTALQLVDWHDYFNVSPYFTVETRASLEKALNNLSQTPEFAQLCKLAQKRWRQYEQFITPRGMEGQLNNAPHATHKIWVCPDIRTASNFGEGKIFIADETSLPKGFAFSDHHWEMDVASLEHHITHELLHLTDPLLVLRTCSPIFRQHFGGILPPDFLIGSFELRSGAYVAMLEDGYTVPHTNDLCARRFGEKKRASYDSVYETIDYYGAVYRNNRPRVGVEEWKVHSSINEKAFPLQRIDSFRRILDQTIDRMINAMHEGTAQRPRESWEYADTTLKQKLLKHWNLLVDDVQHRLGKQKLDAFANPMDAVYMDAVYIEMALQQLRDKGKNGQSCNPCRPDGFTR